jgi:hypothetical protein
MHERRQKMLVQDNMNPMEEVFNHDILQGLKAGENSLKTRPY